MKLSVKIGLCAFPPVAICLFTWLILNPPQIQRNSLKVQVVCESINSVKNPKTINYNHDIFITISNASRNRLICDFTHQVQIAYVLHGVWVTNSIGHAFIEDAELLPGDDGKIENFTPVPVEATSIKTSVSYVSPTWRAGLARKLVHTKYFHSIGMYIWEIDLTRRSQTEWSAPIDLKNE